MKAEDVTVIVPTVEPFGDDFDECIRSIHANGPASIIVVNAGLHYQAAVDSTAMYPDVVIKHCSIMNKRRQICEALPQV